MTSDIPKPGHTERPARAWLVAGALAGLATAAWGLLDPARSPGLPEDAVARVGDALILRAQLDREVERLEAAAGRTATREERLRLVEQLLREELLFQRGVDLGLVESDATVRSAVVQSLVASVTAAADAADPTEGELQQFLDDHADRYTFASAITLDAWTASTEVAAREFLARLAREDNPQPDDALTRVAGLPDGPAPVERLRMFVGPAIAAAAADMPVGDSAVFVRQGRWYVVHVTGRAEGALADLDSVRSQVLIDYRRDLANRQLDDYLDALRQRADVMVELPD